jgi:Holliday junction resolvase
MTSKGRKAKGRTYQQEIVSFLTECGFAGLKSTTMGEAGTDIQDPFEMLPWAYTECKRHERSPTLDQITTLMEKKPASGGWCFFSRRTRRPTLVVMPLSVLEALLKNETGPQGRQYGT